MARTYKRDSRGRFARVAGKTKASAKRTRSRHRAARRAINHRLDSNYVHVGGGKYMTLRQQRSVNRHIAVGAAVGAAVGFVALPGAAAPGAIAGSGIGSSIGHSRKKNKAVSGVVTGRVAKR